MILGISIAIIAIGLIGSAIGYKYYQKIYAPNVNTNDKEFLYFYIYSGATYKDILDSLSKKDFIIDESSFQWVAEKKNLVNKINPGRYKIKNGMSNNELVNLLRSGSQESIKLTFNNIRTKEQLVGKIAKQIEPDSISILNLLNNETLLKQYGFDKQTIIAMFIPNTYKMYWNTSTEKFIKKMNDEYKNFWNEERREKASKIGLSPIQVATLASIVQAEQGAHNEEKPIIAGLYINRLHKRMPLESCPTLVYAIGDFTIQRVLNKDKEIDSPYNTYMYAGLPPSPINIPEISSIEAVLNYDRNEFLYMCARSDFSGYNTFAKTLREHNINAKKYQEELNKRGIKR